MRCCKADETGAGGRRRESEDEQSRALMRIMAAAAGFRSARSDGKPQDGQHWTHKEAEKNKQLRSQRRGEAREVESREVRRRSCHGHHAVLCNALAWHATSSARNSLQRDHGPPVLARNMICSAAHSVSRTWVAEPEVGEIRARSRTAVGPCP